MAPERAAAVLEWREPLAPLRVLAACGWLQDAEVGDVRTRLDALSSSHAVVRVTTAGGRSAVVKQVPHAAAAAGRSLRQELFVYRLARSTPELATVLPIPLHLDEARQVLVIGAIDAPHWTVSTPPQPVGVERLAALMAGWHRATTGTGLWPSPAIGVLELPDAPAVAAADRAPATQRLMATVVDDPDLARSLRTTRRAWQDCCLVHGDIRRENVLVSESDDDATVHVVDWELSGSGDPAWDFASVLSEVLLDDIRGVRDGRLGWTRAQQEVMRRFVRAYVAHGGPVGARGGVDDWQHVAACAVARLVHVACEWSEVQVEGQPGAGPLVLDAARRLLRQQDDIAIALARWAGA